MLTTLITIIGLAIFGIITSVDNAIINAHVLKTMSVKWRQIFLFWGILTAVFLVRGVLPLTIVWLSVPEIGFSGAFHSMFKSSPEIAELLETREGIILIGAGVFLFLVYLHWLFLEKKEPYFVIDKLVKPHYGVWFFGLAAVILVILLYSAKYSPYLMLSAAVGYAIFFIMYGFREQAAQQEARMLGQNSHLSDVSKLMYLEVLDTSFSIDSVMGAFAFTIQIPLIFIGSGVGALIVRELTIKGIDKVARYKWLKNGAMTSIGFLGLFMIIKSFGVHIPQYLPTLTTVGFVGLTFFKSHQLLKKDGIVIEEKKAE